MSDVLKFEDKKELIALMMRALRQENWKESFCKNEKNTINEFFKPKDDVRETARMFEFGGFNTPEQVDTYLRETIDMHIEDIADFIMSKQRTMDTTTMCNEAVGYVYRFRSAEKVETNKFKMVIRKDRDHNTEFGVFVSLFVPIL
jgi:hypothetical protein